MKVFTHEELEEKFDKFFMLSDEHIEGLFKKMNDVQPNLFDYALQLNEYEKFPPDSDESIPISETEKDLSANIGFFILDTMLAQEEKSGEISSEIILRAHDENVNELVEYFDSMHKLGEMVALDNLLKNYNQRDFLTFIMDNLSIAVDEDLVKPEMEVAMLIIFKTLIDSIEESNQVN